MSFASVGQLQQQQAPMSLLDEDFEVISSDQSISPYEMSLLPPQQHPPPPQPPASASTSEVQNLRGYNADILVANPSANELALQQLVETIKQRFDSLHGGLANNNQVLEGLTAKLQCQQLSANSSATRGSPSGQDTTDGQELRSELAKLRNRQEEWQQTIDDYAKLKSQYGLLINTRERLEEERDELLRRIQQQQQDKNKQTESEAAAASQTDDQMRKRVCELESLLQEKIDEESSEVVAQLTQEVKTLRGELDFERAKLFEQELNFKDSLTDLRENSGVQQLEQLRVELQNRKRREQEQQRLYGESDQAVNDILRQAEEANAEVDRLKKQQVVMETSLADNARRMEEIVSKELHERERANELDERIKRLINEHLTERHQLQERIGQLKTAHREELKSQLEQQSKESDRTVNDIIAAAECDKQAMQKEIGDLKARLANAEELLRRRTEELNASTDAVSNMQRYSESLQAERQALKRQLADCQSKCSEAADQAVHFRNLSESRANRVRELESQLSSLQVEHTQLRTNYSQLEHRLTDSLGQEQTWKRKADEAQDTMGEYARSMDNCRRAFEQEVREKETLKMERDQLKRERDQLFDQVNRVRCAFEQQNETM
uniref:GRIP domain-containing protein n=2 Tax=Macrostomum lignano TaxID=282301 RepID=A0A1I8HLX3_9PLAT